MQSENPWETKTVQTNDLYHASNGDLTRIRVMRAIHLAGNKKRRRIRGMRATWRESEACGRFTSRVRQSEGESATCAHEREGDSPWLIWNLIGELRSANFWIAQLQNHLNTDFLTSDGELSLAKQNIILYETKRKNKTIDSRSCGNDWHCAQQNTCRSNLHHYRTSNWTWT